MQAQDQAAASRVPQIQGSAMEDRGGHQSNDHGYRAKARRARSRDVIGAAVTEQQAHTPGPWLQSHRKQPTGVYITQVYDAKGETICDLAWFPVPTESAIETSREANAQLIAAAPDLLEALRDLITAVEAEVNEKGGGGFILARLTDGRDAVRKATKGASAKGNP